MKGNKRKTAEISTEVVEENKQVLLLPNGRVELNYVADDVPWIGFRFHWPSFISLLILQKARTAPPQYFPQSGPYRSFGYLFVTVTRLSAQCSPPSISLRFAAGHQKASKTYRRSAGPTKKLLTSLFPLPHQQEGGYTFFAAYNNHGSSTSDNPIRRRSRVQHY